MSPGPPPPSPLPLPTHLLLIKHKHQQFVCGGPDANRGGERQYKVLAPPEGVGEEKHTLEGVDRDPVGLVLFGLPELEKRRG